ncbi:discoidin domain-containing protein [Cellulophaga sp. F20128]|uniref:DUF4998 domain-containing protein n=1 Tax=Cellulophaga sp. F20128 TaxID=2926413 RepID=UPI001FF691F9|nr:DUF4998 domain-containing protein [Cellulophaga sp. F20128]MCK0158034.1 discoidin domain-containing protein [Cellulophaga sp. F20128]
MKKIKIYILPLSILLLFAFFSCNDTYEFHEEYVKDGEIIYASKVDSLRTLPGDGRIEIAGYLTKGFTINEITVFWDNGENSQTFAYAKSQNETDPLALIVTGLEEKSYEFDVYSKDKEGNKSIKVTVFGTVYGETYRGNLEAREFNSFTFNSDESVSVTLKPSSELTRSTEIKYTNLSGEEIVVIVMADESEGTLEQVNTMLPITYRTYYVPVAASEDGEEAAIDEFDSDWSTYEFPGVFSSIFTSMTLEPISGGVMANWENTANDMLTFEFKNVDKQDQEVVTTVTSSESAGTFTFTPMKSEEQEVEIMISDIYGNSQSMSYTVTPLAAAGKGNWTIVDFSTEEAGGEGPVNGYATAAIDGDTSTFWHSKWTGSGSSYPHHLTIDMGEEKDIAGFEIFRRNGNGSGATMHEFWVSSDNVTFTKIATLDAALDSNDGFLAPADVVTTARYVKYVATAGPSSFTFLGELNVIESLDNTDWSIVDFSSEEAGGEGPVNGYATAAIDGDLATFWHTTWSTGSPDYPHHLTIDLGEEKGIAGFEIFRRMNNGQGAIKHEFWVSSDNVTFTQVSTLDAAMTTNNGYSDYADAVTTARYVKYVAIEGPYNYTFLGELKVFGTIE